MKTIITLEPNKSYCFYCRGELTKSEIDYHVYCYEQVNNTYTNITEESYAICYIVILPHYVETIGKGYVRHRPEYNFIIEMVNPVESNHLFTYHLMNQSVLKPFEIIDNKLFFINHWINYYSFDFYRNRIVSYEDQVCPLEYTLTHWFFDLF